MTVRQRKPIRVKNYDYSRNGVYYITICSVDRKEIFGELKNNVGAGLASARNNIKLSKIGEIIDEQWHNIEIKHRNIKLDEYIIMPNHIHGILIINNNCIDKREDARPSPTISDIICSFKLKCAVEY
ncbi:MAG: hypothetical protein WC214_02900, partial [Candidatus Omnitrophota bacterium]